jgi:hypothetical protein
VGTEKHWIPLPYVTNSRLTSTLSNYPLSSSLSLFANVSNVNTFSFGSQYLNKLIFLTGGTSPGSVRVRYSPQILHS